MIYDSTEELDSRQPTRRKYKDRISQRTAKRELISSMEGTEPTNTRENDTRHEREVRESHRKMEVEEEGEKKEE